jgi:serine/threonine-protein kinase
MELRGLGRYRLVERLAVESDCEFHLARHEDEPATGPPSYIAKLLSPPRGVHAERRRGRFDHEVRLLKSFNHPCIPTLHAAGEQDGIAYLVLDRVHGITLAEFLGHTAGAPRSLSKEHAVYVMGQLADALRHIHTLEFLEAGEPTPLEVVHRDVNPRNIMVSKRGDVVLVGFGKARSEWLPTEHDDPAAGELAYMAPERIAPAGRADFKTDLFAMAVVLWETLRGERCFAGADDAATRDAIERFDISQSGRRVTGLSPKLSEIVRRNLDRDPARRYTGAYQMLQRLAQAPEAQAAEASRAQLAEQVKAHTTAS